MLESSARFTNWNVLYSVGHDSLASPLYEIQDDADEMDFPFRTLGHDVRLLGSCDGVVCLWLSAYDGFRDFLCLWNPATKEYKEIPESPIEFDRSDVCLFAFGYDRKNDDYKLAIGIEADGTKDSSLVQVYTLSSNSWKKSGLIVPYKFLYMKKSGVLVNGDFHWLAISEDNIFLLSLDISEESFEEMSLPMEKDQHQCTVIGETLGEFEGCLCVLVSSYLNGVKINVEVWKMLDYGVQESWTKYDVISHESIITDQFFFRLLGSLKNGEILFLSCGILVLYDPKNRSVREQKIDNFSFLNAENYFESLVSLNSGTHVWEDDKLRINRDLKRKL
ncbi:F-box/kelch-repeat protein At3g06240-like [Papaver somniferum]|uniref:F-box/kelch-repeat protein At3g06240-like n=1 Tax=Papaver somniferum TaxID=3469 RepID=UPI000E6FBF4B|nr:F-box/kelch-repeat protein At3g06240-like [Papaver somniferum]XP_026453945.1 F-box/kelch-repeat protein At3g06240-like [Papaver somniferum]